MGLWRRLTVGSGWRLACLYINRLPQNLIYRILRQIGRSTATTMNITINYDGRYPNLCSGNLKVIIDNEIWNLGNILTSGGRCEYNSKTHECEIGYGKWRIENWPNGFPKFYKKPVLDTINDEIRWGCCGGCT